MYELYHCVIFALRCASDLILPRACLACGRNLYLHEKHLCLYCLADLPLTHYWNRTHNPMADKLNELGEQIGEEIGVAYLTSDFKKKNGYKRSVELSAQYELYRQNYCGCVFSKLQSEK